MATNIKITALSDITSANMTYNDLLAVVDMNGTAETKKSTVQLLGNLILDGAGGSNFKPANISLTAGTVTTAAQPNITSTGTLVSSTVTGNVDAGNINATSAVVATYFSGDGANLTNLPSGSNSAAIANGTSNVDIPASGGNINLSSAGNANIAIITGTGVNVSGTLNATGIITGIGSGLSAIAGANVTGTVPLATLATDATSANAVAGANVSGTVPLATTAGTVTTAAQPNITSTGTLTSLTVSGNVTGQSYVSAATALQTTPVITSALPAAATAGTGARAMVTDADAGSVFGAALTGAGSLTLPVFSDGTIWRVG